MDVARRLLIVRSLDDVGHEVGERHERYDVTVVDAGARDRDGCRGGCDEVASICLSGTCLIDPGASPPGGPPPAPGYRRITA